MKKNIKAGDKIFYEKKFRMIDEVEFDHIHLDDGTVIRENEIKSIGKYNYSTFSMFKEYKKLAKRAYKMTKKMDDWFSKIDKVIEKNEKNELF